jgi:hypothetical protein
VGGRALSSAVNALSSVATAVSCSQPEILQSTLVSFICTNQLTNESMKLKLKLKLYCAEHPVHITKASNPADLPPLLPNAAGLPSNAANSSSVVQEARPQTGAQA